MACLKQHQDQVSDGCKQAVAKAMQQSNGGAGAGTGPASPATPAGPPPATSPSLAPSAAPPAAPRNSPPTTTTKSNPSDHYFLMKPVQLNDQGLGQGRPAYDLMIPKDWQFKGWVNVGVAEGGCFADWFSVVGDVKSADNAIELQIIPKYTWQYWMIRLARGKCSRRMNSMRSTRSRLVPCERRSKPKNSCGET